jgi:trk system potassium uptake protein
MHLSVTLRVLGLLLMVFSLAMIPSIIVSLIFADGQLRLFTTAMAVIFGAGMICWLPVRSQRREMRVRDGFLITVLFWVVLGLAGAVPLALSKQLGLSITDSVFEAMSGLTTTGATVIVGLDALPQSILFYRQLLQWLGGMGIVVLAVAILPLLGIGGMQLYRAETPGPVKDAKLSPRIAETAKALWMIYVSLTLACAGAYWLAGMSLFDALSHAFSTIAIGGFSTHDASIGYFDSAQVEFVAIVFMIIAGMNFSLHFAAWHNRTVRHYIHDPEWRLYLLFLLGLGMLVSLVLVDTKSYEVTDAFRFGFFETVSIATTTGFASVGYSGWPSFIPFLLLMSAFVGACAASTGGGIKVIRLILLYKQGAREIQRLIHPNAVIPIKVGGKPVSARVIDAVWGFLAAYVLLFGLLMLACMAFGEDPITAYSAVGATLNNLGPGLGDAATNYAGLSDGTKYVLTFAMLLGRLELFTLLVIFTPAFWQH